MDLPKCQKCNNGILIPLSDYGQDGASVMSRSIEPPPPIPDQHISRRCYLTPASFD
jgi:hypothetical protein